LIAVIGRNPMRETRPVAGEKMMHWKVFGAAAAALCVVTIVDMQAATGAGRDTMERLTQSAYFSAACRNEAEALGIAPTSEANELLTAFATVARHVASGAGRVDIENSDCRVPVVLLINLLRLNRVDAELAFVSMSRASAADSASPGKIDRILVFVPGLNRYVDPAMPMGKQAVLDQIVVEKATRTHLLGPSLAGAAHGVCPDTCMHVYSPGSQSSVRVRTEVIRP
jgi:hypothetical protein